MKKLKSWPAENVAKSFITFLCQYDQFRHVNGLESKITNVHEILTGMTDKHGRICRYIKHQERNDPKSDWPDGLTEAATGYLIYLIMLLEYYNIDIEKGMIKELNEALKQHGGKK